MWCDVMVELACIPSTATQLNSCCVLCNISALQSSAKTKDIGAIQKGADFVRAFMLGFDVEVSGSQDPSFCSPILLV